MIGRDGTDAVSCGAVGAGGRPEHCRARLAGHVQHCGIFPLFPFERLEKIGSRFHDVLVRFELGDGILAGSIAVPAVFWFSGITAPPLAVIGGAVIFLPLFVFLPRMIRYAMKADTDAVLDAFGKNEQVRKVFWTFFIATAGLVLAQVVDPAAAEKIVGMIAGVVP
jgi:hypothetical protein